jgi:pimeloyl-ACP methyl ester carboxylesterase
VTRPSDDAADQGLVDEFADFVASVPTREIQLPFGRSSFWEVGEGDPLVLLHGVSGGRRVFFRVVPELARRYRVIVPHLRGEEQVDTRSGIDDWLGDVAALFDALELDRVTLYGASFGGYLALAYAGRNDPRVRRVVTQGAFAHFRLRPIDRLVVFASGLLSANLGSRYYGWRVRRGRENANLEEFAPEVAPLNITWQRATPFPSIRRRAQVIARVDVAHAVQRAEAPIAIGHAKRDPVVPFTLGRRIADLRSDVGARYWDDGGHMLMLTHPERFVELATNPPEDQDS